MLQKVEGQQKKRPESDRQSVSAGPGRQTFAYPPATTTHMFGKQNSWMWPRAKMGQTDTDGEKTPTGSLSDDTQRRNGENMHMHIYMLSVRENFNTLLSFSSKQSNI